jgi:acetoin utilization protein AcuB
MRVGRRMSRDVVTIEREASLRRARRIMDHRQIRHLPVVEKGRLVGVITDRDIRGAAPSSAAAIAPEARDEFLDQLKVGHVMSKQVLTATPDTPIEEAAHLMRQRKIGCLPVLEGDRLVGIITETDIFGVLIDVLGVGESAARLEIAIDPRPGFFGDVFRIVEESESRLVSLLTIDRGEEAAVVVLRVRTGDPAHLCREFGRGGIRAVRLDRAAPEAEQSVP